MLILVHAVVEVLQALQVEALIELADDIVNLALGLLVLLLTVALSLA